MILKVLLMRKNTHITLRDMLIKSFKKLKTLKAMPINFLIDTASENQQKKAA